MTAWRTNRKSKRRFPVEALIVAGGDEVRILPPPGTKIQYGVSKYRDLRPPYSVYIIRSSEGWWNNEDGWVESRLDATVFDDDQHLEFSLPLNIPDNDAKWFFIQRDLD